ncbi:putative leader peptide [Streptomyces sp. DH12]
MRVPLPRAALTAADDARQAGAVAYELLLHGRVHVDLARNASALCPGV